MSKTGLKTFAYSFSVSLFAIFAANRVYWHASSQNISDIKIPSKNITLFLKSENIVNPTPLAPIKKISLSSPEKIKMEDVEIVMAEDVIMAEDIETPKIPLDFAESDTELDKPAMVAVSEERKIPPIFEKEELEIPLNRGSASFAEAEKLTIPLSPPDTSNIASVKNSDKHEQVVSAKSSENLVMAKNEPIPLLPIERSHDPMAESKTIVEIAEKQESNKVALADSSIPVNSLSKTASQENIAPESKDTLWKPMVEKTDSPWLVAKAAGAIKNSKVADEDFYNKEAKQIEEALSPKAVAQNDGVQVASDTVKNLLIPIPEDIMNTEHLVPKLSYGDNTQPTSSPEEQESPLSVVKEISQKSKLLTSLNSIFSDKESKVKEPNKNILEEIKQKFQKEEIIGKIMPTEMRLSFQPNRAEISGQTLRWIQAFASRTANDDNLLLEIRIDGTHTRDLQQKRLNLLHNILANKGVKFSQINTVFTQREPNSFIIRTIKVANINNKRNNIVINRASEGYYQQW